MAINLDKPTRWKADIAKSVDMYNDWFMKFAPQAFRKTRIQTTKDVEAALHSTGNMTNIRPRHHPAAPGNPPDTPHVHLSAARGGSPYRSRWRPD